MIQKIIHSTPLTVGAFVLVGIVSVGLWTFAHADGTTISMCVKHTGVSYLIGTGFDNQACKTSEQLVTFNVTGPQGPQGIQGPIGPAGPEGASLKVYDANNEVIGFVAGMGLANDSRIAVFDKELQNLEAGDISQGSISPQFDSSSSVFYASADCSGQGYMDGLTNLQKQSL